MQKGHKILYDPIGHAVCAGAVGRQIFRAVIREQHGIQAAQNQAIAAKIRVVPAKIREFCHTAGKAFPDGFAFAVVD